MTVAELLDRAKQAIKSGETSLHAAAEHIAAAQEQRATQRQIPKQSGAAAIAAPEFPKTETKNGTR
jgi:hypothetical protein